MLIFDLLSKFNAISICHVAYNIAANPANQPIKETVKTWALSAAAAYFQERQSLAKFGAVRARMPKNIRDLTLLV